MNLGIPLELALILLSVNPAFDEMTKAKEWITASLGAESYAVPFSFNYGEQSSGNFIKTWKREYSSEKLDENRTKHTIKFSDPDTHLEIRMESIVYSDFPAVEWVLYFKNNGSSDTPILDNILPLDIGFSGDNDYKLHYAKGALCCIDDFAPMEKTFSAGDSIHLQPGGGRSSSEFMPFFNLDMGTEGVLMAIGWTGEWSATFNCDSEKNLQAKAGMALTHLKLHPSEEIRTPRIMMMFWNGEHTRGNNLLRRFILSHHRPKPNNTPLVLPIILSDWGGASADHHLEIIQRIIKNNLPIEYYWIDAEWFGKMPWHENAGNWEVRKELYPQGFKPISNMLHQSGRKFLLWFEPQRVCKGTPWYELKNRPNWLLELGDGTPEYKQRGINWGISHEDPRWIIYESRRNQIAEDDMLLNIGEPEARKFLTDFLSDKVVEFGLDCYREDFNIAPLEYWRHADTPDRQGMTEIRYIGGLYDMWDELLKRHPHLMIDNCASGGRRIDLETISRSTALWRTDWPADSLHKQCHSYGLFQWVPLHTTAGAVAENEYDLRSSMTGGLMVQFGSDDEKTKTILDQYLKIQKYFYGDYYPLTEYNTSRDVSMAWQFDCPEIGEGMVQAFRRENSSQESIKLYPKALDADATYTMNNLDTSASDEMTGKELMENGFVVNIKSQPGSAIIVYKKSISKDRDYYFDGRISRKVLENYLSRSITMMDLLSGIGNVDDNIRMLINMGAKYAGRALYVWGSESRLPDMLPMAKEIAQKIHALDPEMILQAGIYEIITTDVQKIPIPEWVFEEFGLQPEKRNFSYEAMIYKNGIGIDHWGKNSSIPDMSQLETRMWFFFTAKSYIDVGVEAIHFGQVEIMDRNDPERKHWLDMMTRVRNYASRNARRHLVLCDAHVPSGGIVLSDGKLLFDLHSFPLRIEEVEDSTSSPRKGILKVGYLDSIFCRSKGGITPSGWSCESLPYMVELDNFGSSGKEDQNIGGHWIWGYDEISWFANQPEQYSNDWLRYAWEWIAKHDSNGFLEMPGSRCLASPANGKHWYYANTKSQAVPDGFNQEETIKDIWTKNP
jgi:alpha-galactosidase